MNIPNQLKSNYSTPLIWTSVIRALVFPLSELQVDVQALLDLANIPRESLEHPHGQIPLHSYLQFLNMSATSVDDPLLSLKLSKNIGPELLGALGFLFLSSRNLYEAINNLCHYQNLFQESTKMSFNKGQGYYIFTYDIYGFRNVDTRLDVEFSIAYTYKLIQLFLNNKVVSSRILFRHSPSAEMSKYKSTMKTNCLFNQEVNGIYLKDEDVYKTGKQYAPELYNILVDYLDADLQKKNITRTFTDDVNKILFDFSSSSLHTVEKVAVHLNISVSTLYRKLKEEGTSFRELQAKHYFELSCKYLRETNMNISQISNIIGFSNSSSFTRSFTKWSNGLTPKEYRQLGL